MTFKSMTLYRTDWSRTLEKWTRYMSHHNRMSHNWWFIMMSHRVTSNVWKSAKMGISKLVVSILGCNTFIFGLNQVGFMYDSVLMTSEWLINDDVIQRLRHKRDSSCVSEAILAKSRTGKNAESLVNYNRWRHNESR